jgi:Amino acid synthesis
VKIGGLDTMIDIPLAHKDNIWSFDHLDTLTVSMPDAPHRKRSWLRLALRMAGGHIRGWERDASDDFWSEG